MYEMKHDSAVNFATKPIYSLGTCSTSSWKASAYKKIQPIFWEAVEIAISHCISSSVFHVFPVQQSEQGRVPCFCSHSCKETG